MINGFKKIRFKKAFIAFIFAIAFIFITPGVVFANNSLFGYQQQTQEYYDSQIIENINYEIENIGNSYELNADGVISFDAFGWAGAAAACCAFLFFCILIGWAM